MNNFAKSISLSGDGRFLFVGNENGTITKYLYNGQEWVVDQDINTSLNTSHLFSIDSSELGDCIATICQDNGDYFIIILENINNIWVEQINLQLNTNDVFEEIKISHDGEQVIFKDVDLSGDLIYRIYRKNNGTWSENMVLNSESARMSKSGEFIVYTKENNVFTSQKFNLGDGSVAFGGVKTILNGRYNIESVSGDGKAVVVQSINGNLLFYKYENLKWNLLIEQNFINFEYLRMSENGDVFVVKFNNEIRSYIIESKRLRIMGSPIVKNYQGSLGYFANKISINKDFNKIAIAEPEVIVQIFNIDSIKNYIPIEDVELDFGDTEWFKREAYKLNDTNKDFPSRSEQINYFISPEHKVLVKGNSDNLHPNDIDFIEDSYSIQPIGKSQLLEYENVFLEEEIKQTRTSNWYFVHQELEIQGNVVPITSPPDYQREFYVDRFYPNQYPDNYSAKERYFRYLPYADEDQYLSPWGSRIGSYEFINIQNWETKWQKSIISRDTEDLSKNTSSEDFCKDPNNAATIGYCRPEKIKNSTLYHKDGSLIKNILYGKDFIDNGVSIDTDFYDLCASSFWRSMYDLCIHKGPAFYSKGAFPNESHNFETFEIDGKILPSEFIEFLKLKNEGLVPVVTLTEKYAQDILKNHNIKINDINYGRIILDLNFLLQIGKSSTRCGGSNPYIGYNEDGHFIERRLVLMELKKAYFIDNKDPDEYSGLHDDRLLRTQRFYVPFIEWSAGYSTLNGEKISTKSYRKFYHMNEYFTYRGSQYLMYENFPFKDFNMQPIRWKKK